MWLCPNDEPLLLNQPEPEVSGWHLAQESILNCFQGGSGGGRDGQNRRRGGGNLIRVEQQRQIIRRQDLSGPLLRYVTSGFQHLKWQAMNQSVHHLLEKLRKDIRQVGLHSNSPVIKERRIKKTSLSSYKTTDMTVVSLINFHYSSLMHPFYQLLPIKVVILMLEQLMLIVHFSSAIS